MSSNDITFVARLRDQLTGPAKSATKAVEDLGDAAQRTGQDTTAAMGKAEKATQGYAATVQTSGRKVEQAHDKTGRSAIGNANRTGQAAGLMARAFRMLDGQSGRMATALGRHTGMSAAATERATNRISRALGMAAWSLDRLAGNTGPSRFASGMTSMANGAESASRRIEAAMGRVAKGVALAGGAVAGMALYGGANRLMSLEAADVKLGVMGYDDQAREGIMGTVNSSVEGTPFALDAAATAATQYLASGVTPGDLESKLATTVDLAAIYDMDLTDASGIFSKVIANGAVQGDEAMQLLDRGLNIYGPLAGHLGVDQSKVKGLISEGKVSAEDLFAALGPVVDGGAEKLGGTFKGVFANLRTALSRSGAEFEKPLMEPLKNLQIGLTQVLKDAAPFFAALGASLGPGIALAAEKAPELARALEPLGGPLLELFRVAGDALPGLISGLTTWARILAPIAGFFIRIGAAIAEFVGPHLSWLVPLILGFGALSTTIFGVTAAMIGFKVLRFVAPLMWGLTKAVYGSATAMKVLRVGATLTGRALSFMFPATAMVGRGLLFLGRVILAHPLLLLPVAIYGLVKGLEWLYDNVGWVRDGFDWLGDSVRGVLGFFDDLSAKIGDLIEDKFPRLHSAATTALNFGSGKAEGEGGSSLGDWVMGAGARAGEWAGLPDVGGRRSTLLDVPRHALGGFTASGAHAAILGEEGREFVIPHYASEKLAAVPGALGAIHQGKVPTVSAPTPVAGRSSSGSVPSIGELHVHNPAGLDGETFAREFSAMFTQHYATAEARKARTRELTYSTLTARGAR